MEAAMSAERAGPGIGRRAGKTKDPQGQRATVQGDGGAGGHPGAVLSQFETHFRVGAAVVTPVDPGSEQAHGPRRHHRDIGRVCSLVRDRSLGVGWHPGGCLLRMMSLRCLYYVSFCELR